ncbi:MAG: hypothetical protein ABSH30_16960 [Acidimicrobiales bacterium]|jgi:hypothetical protein
MKLINRAHLHHVALLAAGVLIGAFAIAGPSAGAGTLKAGSIQAGTKTGHLTLAASAFTPDGLHNTAEDYFNEWDPTTLSNQDAGRCFNTGAILPNGAKLSTVTAYYTAGSADMYFEMNRQELNNNTAVALVSFDTTANSTPTYTSMSATVAAADAIVNTTKYAYSFGVCPSATTTFSGVSVTYTTG